MKLRYVAVLMAALAAGAAYLFWNGPHAALGSGPNIVVLCSSCSYEGLPQTGHLVLLDASSGEVWIYSDAAMEGKAKPVDWGNLVLGRPVARKGSGEANP